MKILKLVGLFVIIAGVIIGILFIKPPGDEGSSNNGPNDMSLTEYKADFAKDWDEKHDWDEKIFRRHCREIKTLAKDYDVTELNDYNISEASDIVNEKIFSLWKSANCKKVDVDRYRAAVDTIVHYDAKMANNIGVKKIKEVYGVYADAYNFVIKPLSLSPGFNGTGWNNFKNYAEQQRAHKNRILANPSYKNHLSNITQIKDGLGNLDSRLSQAQRSFYIALENQIYAHYNRIPSSARDRSKLNQLSGVVSKYYAENPGGSARLRNLQNRFRKDVEENENRE